MTIKELQGVISSATSVQIYVAKTSEDASNEKHCANYYMDKYSFITGLDDWEIDYIYPRAKDELEAWCVR